MVEHKLLVITYYKYLGYPWGNLIHTKKARSESSEAPDFNAIIGKINNNLINRCRIRNA